MTVVGTDSRRAALRALRAVRSGRLLDAAFSREAAALGAEDRRFTHELLYGTVRLKGRLDHLLAPRIRRSPDEDVQDVLRLALYQLLFMDGVPAYAAISESVELVRWSGKPRAAGFVNGVLRSIQRDHPPAEPPEDWTRDPTTMAAWGSHPKWLVDRWIARFGAAQTGAILQANNRRPELFLTVTGEEVETAVERLRDAGLEASAVDGVERSFRLAPGASPADVLRHVPGVIQDPAAAAVVEFAAVSSGARVVDLCAAPGGKAVTMATTAAEVLAIDRSYSRLRYVRENADRTGVLDRMRMVVADGRRPPLPPASADFVLVDAPCSGTGTFRRHPDGRWRIKAADIAALAVLQEELLDAAAGVVRPGGWLVYATCSIEREENEDQMESFLTRHPEYMPDPVRRSELVRPDADGWLSLHPDRSGFDGAFAARLRRVPG